MDKRIFRKRTVVFLSLMILLIFVLMPMIGKPIPRRDKFKVTGTSQYLKYLNAGLDISKRGVPLNGLKVYLNELLLNNRWSGFYSNGTPYNYKMKIGNKIVISYVPNRIIRRVGSKFRHIILGEYKINNLIKWVYPLPNSTIFLRRRRSVSSRYIIFSWNYVGRILKTRVTLQNFTKHRTVFSTVLTGEHVSIPTNLLKSGDSYRFDLEVVGPMGHFNMNYSCVTSDSKIDFYYWDHLYFKVM